jgi:hypothetical protein
MEDAVSKLLSKVAIPNAMIEYTYAFRPKFSWKDRTCGAVEKVG